MAKAENKLHFRCEGCGKPLEAVWKSKVFLGKKHWIAEECDVCHTKTDLSNAEVVSCPHCQSIVLKEEKFCPACKQPLDISIDHRPIVCPNEDCGMTLYLPKNYKGNYTCQICHTLVNESYIRSQMKKYFQEDAPAKLITLPSPAVMDEKKLVVYKEADTQFPFMSQLLVNEGTYGLLLQNGVCQYPLSSGTHLLKDSKLTETGLFEAAMDGEAVVFNTEILCVIKALPEIRHSLMSAPIRTKPVDEAPAREFTVEAVSAIRCTVDDAKAFASRVGFNETTKDELTSAGSWLHERTASLLYAAFDQAARDAYEIYASTGSIYTYKTELTQRISDKIASALADDGLFIGSITLGELKITETAESTKRQQEYAEKRKKIETVKLPDVQTMRNQGLVIYQHDKDCFEYKSRVQVSEGTYGLLLQNGACQRHLAPGNYPLAECSLEDSSRYDAAMNGEDVVFYSSLFSVLKTLPGFEWYHLASFTDIDRVGNAPAREYTIRAEGTLRFQVDDAKAFATQVGLHRLSVAELFHAHRPAGQLPSLNAEIEQNYPGENTDGWLYTRVKSIMNSIFSAVCRAVIGTRLDTQQIDSYRYGLPRRLKEAFNAELQGTGLSVTAVELSAFSAAETEESRKRIAQAEQREKNRGELLKAAKAQLRWDIRDMELHLKDQQTATFNLSFKGDCRLDIEDEKLFFSLSEVQKSLDAGTPDAIRAFLQSKLQGMIENRLAYLAQDFINRDKIANPADPYAYDILKNVVRDEIDRDLASDGLRFHHLNIFRPDDIQFSKALKDSLAIHDSVKREEIKRYAESKLDLRTDPIRIHMKDHPTVYVEAAFSGSACLRVEDPTVFYETSEVKGFLTSDPFVSAQTVSGHYQERINLLFADLISRIAQAIVDQTDADIRELNRLTGLLQNSLLSNVAARVKGFGMSLFSLDMGPITVNQSSENKQLWENAQKTRAGNAWKMEVEKLENDKTIYSYDEKNRVVIAEASSDSKKTHQFNVLDASNMESQELVEQKKAELEAQAAARAKQKADRVFQERMDDIRKQAELDRLVAAIASDNEERSFEELKKEYEHKYTLRELEINQSIREAQIRQQAGHDTQFREDHAKFERMLNEAENKRLLGEILHKIDASDLDWRKKLDEYARLQQKLHVTDQVELEQLAAEGKTKKDALLIDAQTAQELQKAKTQAEKDAILAKAEADASTVKAAADSKIQRDANETFLLVGQTKIKLATAEAELMEAIARYSEDRQQRIQDRQADYDERKASLDFEHRMRERQEAVIQQMDMLRQKYDHELALRDRDDKLAEMKYELDKLKYTLDHLSHELSAKSDVDKSRIQADAEIKKAEAQFKAQHEQEQLKAQEARYKEQLEHDEKVAKQAAEYQKMFADIQLAIEKLRNETERNKDDSQAKIAVAQFQSDHKHDVEETKRSIEQLNEKMDKRFSDLLQTMDKIIDSQKRLKDKLKDLHKGQPMRPPYSPQFYPQPYFPSQPSYPANPTYAPASPYGAGQPLGAYGAPMYNQLSSDDLSVTGGLGQAPSSKAQSAGADGTYGQASNVNAAAAGAPAFTSQSGMPTQICPHCGKLCSAQATICEHCNAFL